MVCPAALESRRSSEPAACEDLIEESGFGSFKRVETLPADFGVGG